MLQYFKNWQFASNNSLFNVNSTFFVLSDLDGESKDDDRCFLDGRRSGKCLYLTSFSKQLFINLMKKSIRLVKGRLCPQY